MKRCRIPILCIIAVAVSVTVEGLISHETSHNTARRRFLAGIFAGCASAASSAAASSPSHALFQQQPDHAFLNGPSMVQLRTKKASKQKKMEELQDVRLDQCDKMDLQRFDQCFFYGNAGTFTNNGRFLTPPKTIRNGPPTW